ncbi:hypothetical protein LQ567_13295 [Niabella pedocola]|uniref:Uncharacterized protein n=1 Tax=Niabella pedocola TaxID=1752077 RepID=A0ABS8PRQ0_9BACT|nr:hypothetical protein [Niabella pedocola]MCD2423744.1 hypothetical protein [Niabella pedocola]
MKITCMLLFGILVLGACKRGPILKICSKEYLIYGVRILSSTREPVPLDTFYTRFVATNRTFHSNELWSSREEGVYAITSDGQSDLFPVGKNIKLQFIGIKHNKIIVNEPYMFRNDGCHVEKKSGKSEVIVDL